MSTLGIAPWNKGKHWSTKIKEKISKSLMGRPSTRKGKKVGHQTREHILKRIRKGEKSHLWRGGKTPLIILLRSLFLMRQWRSDIFTRDNFSCCNCGDNKGGNLQAHHKKWLSAILDEYNIKTVTEAENCEELWSINNGITLCKNCHILLHKKKK